MPGIQTSWTNKEPLNNTKSSLIVQETQRVVESITTCFLGGGGRFFGRFVILFCSNVCLN